MGVRAVSIFINFYFPKYFPLTSCFYIYPNWLCNSAMCPRHVAYYVFIICRLWDQLWSMLYYIYKANFIPGNKALILVTKLSSSVTGGGTLLLDVCWLVTGQCVSRAILCWTDVKRVLSCDRTWDSTDTLKWLKWYIVLLVQTKVVLYCSAMGYARYSISCQCIVCISYIMGHSDHGRGSVEDWILGHS